MLVRRLAALAALGAAATALPAVQAAAQPLLPDLQPIFPDPERAYLDPFAVPGHVLYRFDSVVLNLGPGALEVLGSRAASSGPMTSISQVEYGAPSGVPSAPPDPSSTAAAGNEVARVNLIPRGAEMYYAQDGHFHWHFQGFAHYELQTTSGRTVAPVQKAGFCMFDTWGEVGAAFYEPSGTDTLWCAHGNPDATVVRMGISPGRGDLYYSDLGLQWIDVTGLRPGRYRLFGVADPRHILDEANRANDTTITPRVIPGVVAANRRAMVHGRGPTTVVLHGAVVQPGAKLKVSAQVDAQGRPTLEPIGSAVSYRVVTPPRHGTLTSDDGDTRVVYRPGPSFHGRDLFRYQAVDAHGLLASPPARVLLDRARAR